MRPAVVAARLEDVDLVVGLRPLLGGVERAVRREIDALHVAVAIGEDVAAHAVDHRIVVGDRAVEVHPQRLALIGEPVLARRPRPAVGRRCASMGMHQLPSWLFPPSPIV